MHCEWVLDNKKHLWQWRSVLQMNTLNEILDFKMLWSVDTFYLFVSLKGIC